ncbi:MAG TPA: phosphate uptake regulator PhoU [Candidatus Thermoplasmatota archaeon]|nr:phosphate uptake regulator PhoU [Candidatus Thermoplasmatota archaeon]
MTAGDERARWELRKVQMTGGSSYTVTLPKEWVKAAKLEAGDVVGMLHQPDGSLALHPRARAEAMRERLEIQLDDDNVEHAFRRIVAAYLAGYDVIAVKSRKPFSRGMREAVQRSAKRIIGLEVVDDEPHVVVLRDFLDASEFPIDRALRRMSTLTRAMQDDALRAFREDPDEAAASMAERDDEVDRLYWMVNKQFHGILRDPSYARNMGLTASQALSFLMVARVTERVADHALRLAVHVQALHASGSHARLETKMEKQAKKAVQMFSDALGAFHKGDVAEANRIIEDSKAFATAQEAAIRESHSLAGEDVVHVTFVLDSIARTAAYAADVAETAINHRVAARH